MSEFGLQGKGYVIRDGDRTGESIGEPVTGEMVSGAFEPMATTGETTMSATTELAARLKAAIRGEGEPGHPGEMISVVEAEYLIDEVFAEVEAAPSDTDREAWDKAFPKAAGDVLGIGSLPSPWDAFMAGRASQQARATVTDDMVRVARRAYVSERNTADGAAMRAALAAAFASQPVQVEVTDDMVEKAGRVMYSHWDEWDSGDEQAIGERQLMRAALSAALGGGE